MIVASSFWFWDKPSWGWAEFWALLILLVPSLLIRVTYMTVADPGPAGKPSEKRKQPFALALVNGADNRWSTSKASVVIWTYAVLFAFVAILLHTRGHGLTDLKLSDQYLLLLGIPTGAAVAAKAITQDKVDQDAGFKTDAP